MPLPLTVASTQKRPVFQAVVVDLAMMKVSPWIMVVEADFPVLLTMPVEI